MVFDQGARITKGKASTTFFSESHPSPSGDIRSFLKLLKIDKDTIILGLDSDEYICRLQGCDKIYNNDDDNWLMHMERLQRFAGVFCQVDQ